MLTNVSAELSFSQLKRVLKYLYRTTMSQERLDALSLLSIESDMLIPNPLRCFNCQKYSHSSRACKNPAACVKCGKAGHEGASCSNQEQCANCKGKHAASSRECPKWKLEKQVQQIKLERGISFPDARKAVLSEQSTNTSSKRTVASVVSGTTTMTSQRSQKQKVSVAIQTELT